MIMLKEQYQYGCCQYYHDVTETAKTITKNKAEKEPETSKNI